MGKLRARDHQVERQPRTRTRKEATMPEAKFSREDVSVYCPDCSHRLAVRPRNNLEVRCQVCGAIVTLTLVERVERREAREGRKRAASF